MPFTRPYLAARILMSTVIVGILFGVFVLASLINERAARIDALQKQERRLTEQQQEILETQSNLSVEQRNLVDLSNRVKMNSCTEDNERIKKLLLTEYIKDLGLMNKLLPKPRTMIEELVANTFVAEGFRTTVSANPLHDCSATTLKLLPLPPIIPLPPETTTSKPK